MGYLTSSYCWFRDTGGRDSSTREYSLISGTTSSLKKWQTDSSLAHAVSPCFLLVLSPLALELGSAELASPCAARMPRSGPRPMPPSPSSHHSQQGPASAGIDALPCRGHGQANFTALWLGGRWPQALSDVFFFPFLLTLWCEEVSLQPPSVLFFPPTPGALRPADACLPLPILLVGASRLVCLGGLAKLILGHMPREKIRHRETDTWTP